MGILLISVLLLAGTTLSCHAQDPPVRIIVFGAHPDDCENIAGGSAILWQIIKALSHNR